MIILFALASLPSSLKLRRDKPLSPASGFPVSRSQQVNREMSGRAEMDRDKD